MSRVTCVALALLLMVVGAGCGEGQAAPTRPENAISGQVRYYELPTGSTVMCIWESEHNGSGGQSGGLSCNWAGVGRRPR